LLVSLFYPSNFHLNTKPPISNEDITFSHEIETYLSQNNISHTNLTISNQRIKAYWYALLLHMEKGYAVTQYLEKYSSFQEWLDNPTSQYFFGEYQNSPLQDITGINHTRIQTILREDNRVLMKKLVN
jgi:hypothetical protein